MNHRERFHAIMHYQDYDRLPVVSFGYWKETLRKWASEGYIASPDVNPGPDLGFDFMWDGNEYIFGSGAFLFPFFEEKVIREEADGSRIMQDREGQIVRVKPWVESIPSSVGTLLTGRKAWEKEFLPRLQADEHRIDWALLKKFQREEAHREIPLCFFCGSLYGQIRNFMGLESLCYLIDDDEDLYYEIIDTMGKLSYDMVKMVLDSGAVFDFAHFWEDICCKNGPLLTPKVFKEHVAPHYRRITELLAAHGMDIVEVDSDGCIDALLPIWLENGVNTMFPIEVGTWNASIGHWREKYGKRLRGVGGMNKAVFGMDKAAVDREIDRLAPLVDLGGYLPCPDHNIPPDAKYPLVAYYCEQMHKRF